MRSLIPGMESIVYQNNAFHKELSSYFKSLFSFVADYGQEATLEDLAPHAVQLSEIIKHRTNLAVDIEFQYFGTFVQPPQILKNHVMFNELTRKYSNGNQAVDALNKSGGLLGGTVDLRAATVGGFFAEVTSTIYIPVVEFFYTLKVTPEEAAAIILHEIGHIFLVFEFITTTTSAAVVMHQVSKDWISSTPKERKYFLTSISKAMEISNGDLDPEALSTVNDSKVVESIVFSNVVSARRSELGTAAYDMVNYEALADDFALRFGAGRHLVTALEKIDRHYDTLSYRTLPGYMVMEVLKVLMFIGLGPIVMIFLALDKDNANYDRPIDRLRRIRDGITARLKDKNLTAKVREELVEDIRIIDITMERYSDRRQWSTLFMEMFGNTFASKRRNQTLFYRELEAMANNPLYARAAELELNK